jgi:hypothetical protein
VESKVQNIDHAPRSITIAIRMHDILYPTDRTNKVEIDLLPLLKIGRANSEFSCDFIHSLPLSTTSGADYGTISEDEQSYLEDDKTTIHALMQCNNKMWLKGVTNGNILKVMVSLMGTVQLPEVKIYISEDLKNKVRGSDAAAEEYKNTYLEVGEFEEDYLNRNGMDDIFYYSQGSDEGGILCSIHTLNL